MALGISILRLFLCLGYPPLIAYFVSLILFNDHEYMFSPIEHVKANIVPGLFMIPQYAMCFLFLVFHLVISLCHNQCTVILVVFVSSSFSFFAGISLSIIEQFTSGFQLHNNQTRSLFSGFFLVALVQFIGYSSWQIIIHRNFTSSQANIAIRQYTSSQDTTYSVARSHRLKYGIFTVFACFGYLSFIAYSVSVTTIGIEYKYTYTKGKLHVFHGIFVNVPVLLYPILVALQIMIVAYKKLWMSWIVIPVKTLLDFALGSIILYFVFNYYNYWIQNQFFTTEKPDDDDVKKSFIFVVVSCLLLLISNGLTMLSCSSIWWSHLQSTREVPILGMGSIFNEENQPLLSSTRDV